MRVALLLCLALSGFAVEPPPVPDPFGLGERLALIDHLRDRYQRVIPAGTELAELQGWHAEAWLAEQATVADPLANDERQRLRHRLLRQYGIETPDDSERELLLALLHSAEDSRAAAIAADVSSLINAQDWVPAVSTPETAPSPATPDAGTTAAIERPTAEATVKKPASASANAGLWQREQLTPHEAGIRSMYRWHTAERGVVCVQFGDPGGLDFDGACAAFASMVARAPADVQRAVFLIGHGGGVTIGEANLKQHLKANRENYETTFGSLPARPVDCLVVASCSKGGSVQMGNLRDGLGYWPLRRVCTGHRTYANLPTVIAASAAVLTRPLGETFRGSFRWDDFGVEAASTGEVGDGARSGNLQVYRVSLDADGRLAVTEQR